MTVSARKKLWHHRSMLRLTGWVLTVTLVLSMAVLWVLSQGGITLPDWARERVEQQIDTVLAPLEMTAEIGAFSVALRDDFVPAIIANDIALRSQAGRDVARLDQIDAVLSRDDAIIGQLAPKAIRMSGLSLEIYNDELDGLRLGLGDGAEVARFPSLQALISGVYQAFERPGLDELTLIGIEALTLALDGSAQKAPLRSVDGSLRILKAAERIDIDLDFGDIIADTGLNQENGRLAIHLESQSPEGAATGELRLRGINPARISDAAGASPLSGVLAGVDAPVSMTLQAARDDAGQFAGLTGDIRIGSGRFGASGSDRQLPIDHVSGRVRLNADASRTEITEFQLSTPGTELSGKVTLHASDGQRILAQIALNHAKLDLPERYPEPLILDQLWADLSVNRDFQALELVSATVETAGVRLNAQGQMQRDPQTQTPSLALDLRVAELSPDQVVTLWPNGFGEPTRRWIRNKVQSGAIRDAVAAVRWSGGPADIGLSFAFDGAQVQPVAQLPPVTGASGRASLLDHRFSVSLDQAGLTEEGRAPIQLSSGAITLPDIRDRSSKLELVFQADAPVSSTLSLLDAPVFKANRPPQPQGAKHLVTPDTAAGQVSTRIALQIPVRKGANMKDVTFQADGVIRDFTSDALVQGKSLTAEELRVAATNDLMQISGPGAIDGLPLTATYTRPMGPSVETPGAATVQTQAPLTAELARAFGVTLPPGSISGAGRVNAEIDIVPQQPSQLRISGDLTGLQMGFAGLGWSKAKTVAGSLEVVGQLGPNASLSQVNVTAPGLRLRSAIPIGPDQRADEVRFSELKVGRWLDASGVFQPGRNGGEGSVRLTSGSADLRYLPQGDGNGGKLRSTQLNLDRVTIDNDLYLTQVRGDLNRSFSGNLTANINGDAPVRVTLEKQAQGTAMQITSSDAGKVVRAMGLSKGLRRGSFDLRLFPRPGKNHFFGQLRIKDAKMKDTPAFAEILSAISLIGALDLAAGQGIPFTDIRADFTTQPGLINISKASAVGPSLGLSLDGKIYPQQKRLDLQGVVSPIYFLNQAGSFMTRRGEGLIGISYKLRGSFDKPKVAVNPLSMLTPGFLREIFRNPSEGQVSQQRQGGNGG